MKRIPLFQLILLFLIPLVVLGGEGERITSYDAFITVKPAGDMTVTETITVVSEGDQIKHGIYRDFPTRYKDQYGNRMMVAFEVQAAQKDGKPEPWWTEDMENGVRVYVGRKDVTLAPGTYTYALTYRTDRQIGFFEKHDELYWNVTGNGWAFPIEMATARVELPSGAQTLSTEGYTGPYGEKGTDFTTGQDDHGRPTFSITKPLGVGEGLTIVVMWPKGFVREPTRSEKTAAFFADNASAVAGAAGVLVLFIYYLFAWFRVGKDPGKGVIIPRYEAPKDCSPAAMRYIMRMGFDDKAFAAAVVNMAVKGYLSIDEEEDGTYALNRKGRDYSGLSPDEARVAQQLFADSTSLSIKSQNHATIKQAIKDLRKNLAIQYEKIYFLTNKNTLVPGLVISAMALITIVILGRSAAEAGFMTIWLSGWTTGCAMLVFVSVKAWRSAILGPSQRIPSLIFALFITVFALPFLAGEAFGLWVFSTATSIPAVLFIFVIVLLNILFYHFMKAPTIKGRQVMDLIEGLKLYLSVAEKDRLNQLVPPEKTPEVFEKFLPYALALDVEQEWCEQFAHVMAQVHAGNGYAPTWYTGNHFTDRGLTGLASSLSAMSSSISSSSSPPGSSSGGRGGGSSGGGGGGGGGGGW